MKALRLTSTLTSLLRPARIAGDTGGTPVRTPRLLKEDEGTMVRAPKLLKEAGGTMVRNLKLISDTSGTLKLFNIAAGALAIILTFTLSSCNKNQPVTLASLLAEMTDRTSITYYPDQACLLYTSPSPRD